MPRAAPIITALNAGQFSPLMQGRVDLEKHSSGCKRIENFIGLVQGPACRRGGTAYATPTKSQSDRSWQVKFEFSATDAVLLEVGNLYIRFIDNATHTNVAVSGVTAWSALTNYTIGDLASSGGVNYYCKAAHINQVPPNATYWYPLTGTTYEIPSPYTLADLTNTDGSCALKVEQSGDVLYIANDKRTYAPRKLTRYATTRWILEEYRPTNGPLLEENFDSAVKIQASANTGSVTLTATGGNVFASTDVGRLVKLTPENLSEDPWEVGKAYIINDLSRFSGKTYKATTAATSGTSPPIHEGGKSKDGKSGVEWDYQHAGYGMLRITAYTSPTQVTATVITDSATGLLLLPVAVVSTSTYRWCLGAWSATTEYPGSVTFWKNRLWWGGRLRLWASVPNDFESMAGDFYGTTSFDAAIWWQVQSRDVNDILWLVGGDRLIIGTGGGEFIGREITDTSPLGPQNFQTLFQSKHRASGVQPIIAGESILYTQRARRKLLSMNYSLTDDKFTSNDLAVLADRITRGRIIDMAFQAEPFKILWCVLENGTLLGFTFDRDQDVVGWHKHPIGGSGYVESVEVIPTADGASEELWLQVRRTIGGSTKRFHEYMMKPWEGPDEDGSEGDDQADAFYVDCGLLMTSGSPQTVWSVPHLNGETVQILADGAATPDQVVTGNNITLARAASQIVVGYQMLSRLVPNRIDAGSADGTSQGKLKRIDELVIRFVDTLGGKVGRYDAATREGVALESISLRAPATPMGTAPPFVSGDHVMKPYPGNFDRDAYIEIRQDQPLPMTIAALMPRVVTNQ